jgi:CRISPR-associated protein Cas2
MISLITYDISDPKRLRKMHKFLKEYGLNTQKSVFECDIDDAALKVIRQFCRETLALNQDDVRIYKICSRCMDKVVISGRGIKLTQLDFRIM